MIGSKYWIILVIHFWIIKLTNLLVNVSKSSFFDSLDLASNVDKIGAKICTYKFTNTTSSLLCLFCTLRKQLYMTHKVLWCSCMCLMCPLVLCSAAMACLLTCRGIYNKIATIIKAQEHLKSPHKWNLSTNSWYS